MGPSQWLEKVCSTTPRPGSAVEPAACAGDDAEDDEEEDRDVPTAATGKAPPEHQGRASPWGGWKDELGRQL